MKEKILKLREEGKTYKEIKEELNCSKGTIAYHCGEGQKEKTKERTRKSRKTIHGHLCAKLDRTLKRKIHYNLKCRQYNLDDTAFYKKDGRDAFIKFIIENPVCYLTGEKIDLYDTKSYEIDHIIPCSRGGLNDFSNLGLVTRNANRVKCDLFIDELYDICKKILKNKKI